MATKRFTDIDIWKKKWFRELTPKQKLLWFYLKDICDVAGYFELDLELASFQIGEKIKINDLEKLSSQIKSIDASSKYIILDFVSFQYKKLNKKANPHKKPIEILLKNGFVIEDIENIKENILTRYGYSNHQGTMNNTLFIAQDKDKDKDKDKGKDKDKDKGKDKDKDKDKGKDKGKEKVIHKVHPKLSGNKSIEKFLEQCSEDLQKKWIEIYKDPEFIKSEILKAECWMIANPDKPKTRLGAFLSNWLSHNINSQNKAVKSNPKTFAQIKQENLINMEFTADDFR